MFSVVTTLSRTCFIHMQMLYFRFPKICEMFNVEVQVDINDIFFNYNIIVSHLMNRSAS